MKVANVNKSDYILNQLHKDAKKDIFRVGKGVMRSIFQPIQPADFKNAYLPITKEQGDYLSNLVITNNCKEVVEFGTSFGISTIYLADAVRQTGGKVITTELIKSKAETALENIDKAGLSDFVDVRIGNAMETLSAYSEPIDFLFLDGWKDLYLPLFQMLEPYFHSGTIIYADNMDMRDTQAYADYVLREGGNYTTERIHDGKAFLTSIRQTKV